MRTRLVAALGVLATLAAPAACSSQASSGHTAHADAHTAAHSVATSQVSAGRPSTASHSGSCRPDVTPQICVTVAITGSTTVSGTGRTTAPAPPEADPSWTCAKLAANAAGDDRDLGDALQSVGGHALQWDLSIGSKPGAGTFPLSHTATYIAIDGTGYSALKGTANVTLHPDYSASFTFANMTSDSGAISGSITWTCLDPA